MNGGTIISVDYTMKQRAYNDGIVLNETTLQSTINKARKISDIFLKEDKKRQKFEDRLYELLKEESKDIRELFD